MTEAIHRPGPTYEVTHLAKELNEDKELDEFVRLLCARIKATKKQRGDLLEDDWDACEMNYWAQGEREDAGTRDSQLDFTLTFEICQDASSNLANPVFAQDQIFVAKARPGYKEMAAAHDSLLDWMADRGDYMALVDDSLRYAQIFTKTIVKAGWSYREKTVKYWDWDQDDTGEMAIGAQPVEKTKVVPEAEGCYPHVVDTRRIFHPIPTKSIDEAEWFGEEFDTSVGLIEAEKEREYYRKDLDPKSIGNSDNDPKEDRKKLELFVAHNVTPIEQDADAEQDKLKLMEVYTTFKKQEVILILDVERGTWVAAIENFFQSHQRPYADFSWYSLLHSIDGKSLCSVLEPLHRAYVAIMNILLDAGTRSVEPLIIALEDLGLSEYLDNGRLAPGLAEVKRSVVDSIDSGIKEIRLSTGAVDFLLLLAARIEKHMRDAASIPAAFRGEELAERPTATGTTSIIEKAMQPLYKLMERFRLFLSRICRMQYARYRQFNPQSFQFFLQSGPDGEMLSQTAQFPPGFWEDQIGIETSVNSQTMSKQIKKQEILAMVDKLPEIWRSFGEMGMAATEGSPLSPLAGQFLDASTIVLKDFFTEFEIPEVKDVLEVDGAKMAGEAIAQSFAQYEQQIQELEQQLVAAEAQLTDIGGEIPKAGPASGQSGPTRPSQAA